MPLNCGAGDNSWETLSKIKPVPPKGNQLWIFTGRTDAEAEAPVLWTPDRKSRLTGKDPDAGKDWRQEETGTKEDEMAGWHHWLNGHEFEQAPGNSEEQGRLLFCSPWTHKESDMTQWLNTDTMSKKGKSRPYQLTWSILLHGPDFLMLRRVIAQSTVRGLIGTIPDVSPAISTLASSNWASENTGHLPGMVGLGSLPFLPSLACSPLLRSSEPNIRSRRPGHPACYLLFTWAIQEPSRVSLKQGRTVASMTRSRDICWISVVWSPISLKYLLNTKCLSWKVIDRWPHFNKESGTN